jgi:hypothetical protein
MDHLFTAGPFFLSEKRKIQHQLYSRVPYHGMGHCPLLTCYCTVYSDGLPSDVLLCYS